MFIGILHQNGFYYNRYSDDKDNGLASLNSGNYSPTYYSIIIFNHNPRKGFLIKKLLPKNQVKDLQNTDLKLKISNIGSMLKQKIVPIVEVCNADGRSLQLRPNIFPVFNVIFDKSIFIRKPFNPR